MAAFVDEPAWTFGEEEDEEAEYSGGNALETEGNTPLTIISGREADIAIEG